MKDLINRLREIKNRWADEGNVASEAADALEAQAKEIEALRADAERYRWLRRLDAAGIQVYDGANDRSVFGEELDAAIDAARRK